MGRQPRIRFTKLARRAQRFALVLLIPAMVLVAVVAIADNASSSAQRLPAERLAAIETSAGRTAASMYYEVRSLLRDGRLDDAAFTLSVLTPTDEPGPAISNMHAALLLLRGNPADRAAAYAAAQRAVRLAPTVGEFQIMRALSAPDALKPADDGAVRLSAAAVDVIKEALSQLDKTQGNARWITARISQMRAETRRISEQIDQLQADDYDPIHPFLFTRFSDLTGIALIASIGDEEAARQTQWIASRYAQSQDDLAEALRKKRILEIQRNLILEELEGAAPDRRRLLELELDEVDRELRLWQIAIERHERELAYLASEEQMRLFRAKQVEILDQETVRLTAEMGSIRATYQQRLARLESELIETKRQVFVLRTEYAALQNESRRRISLLEKAREHFQSAAGKDEALLRQVQARLAGVEAAKEAILVEQDAALAQRETMLSEAQQKVAVLERELANRENQNQTQQGEVSMVIAGLQRDLDAARAALIASKQAFEDRQDLHRRTTLRLEEEVAQANYELTNWQQLASQRDQAIKALRIHLVELQDSDQWLRETQQDLQIAEDRLTLLNKTRRELEVELAQYRSELGLAQQQVARLSQVEKELAQSRQEMEQLRAQLVERDAQADELANTREKLASIVGQLETTQAALDAAKSDVTRYEILVQDVGDKSAEITKLKAQLSDAKAEKATVDNRIAEADSALAVASLLRTDGDTLQLPEDVRWGRYHALVIGNNDYQIWNKLNTPVKDARAVADMIANDFGYEVTLLENATRAEILGALENYERTLRYDDNLLIYYAGHGQIVHNRGIGYWIPVDAALDSTIDWISDDQLRRFMKGLRAKQVMIVADSCFSGTLANEERAFGNFIRLASVDGNSLGTSSVRGRSVRSGAALGRMLQGRARVVLSSGGERPVVDEYGEDGHSIFASAFLKVLNETREPLNGSALAVRVGELVSSRIAQVPSLKAANYSQYPRFETMSRSAGHDLAADFVFAPEDWLKSTLLVKTGLLDMPPKTTVVQ